jgi:hypothetical protein
MVERVIIGKRTNANGTEQGMWVSKPGKSALSTNTEDFLLDTTTTAPRVIRSGVITNPTLTLTSSSSPTISNRTSIPSIVSETRTTPRKTVYLVGGAEYYTRGNYNSDGYAIYTKDYYFNSDKSSLGYVPITHIAIGFASDRNNVGDNYPKVLVDDKKITLSVYQNWDGTTTGWQEKKTGKQYWPAYYDSYGTLYWKNPAVFGGTGTDGEKGDITYLEIKRGAQPGGSLATDCIIHYAIYNRAMVLP